MGKYRFRVKGMQTRRPGKRPKGRENGGCVRSLPAVGRLMGSRAFRRLAQEHGPALVADLLREEIGGLRRGALSGAIPSRALREASRDAVLAARVEAAARRLLAPSPRTVINATGVVAHTNLGRSVLSAAAASRVAEAATGYLDLEYDLSRGARGDRHSHLEPLLARLFPGRASLAVNNNAAAILLALRALAKGREAIVSRGELVEIGGSFRVPDILAASGARLREVGTTNRTRASDYEAAVGPRTGLILKVHTSNFKIVGFGEETPVAALSAVARKAGVPLVVDWGSGDLVDLAPLGIGDEVPVRRLLDEGADLVTFSGDKLLGGPQAGLVVGRADLVERLGRDPLARACRLDRLLIAALRETLAAHVRGRAFEEVPTLRMIAAGAEEIGRRAGRLRGRVARIAGPAAAARLRIEDGVSRTGGGSSPLGERPTRLLVAESPTGDAGGMERALRLGDPPVLGRVREGRLLLDLRTVLETQEETLAARLAAALAADQTPKRKLITSPSRTT